MSEDQPKRPSTIKDVALAAGVSLGTASKALNGQGQLRPGTIERVRAAARQLNFHPNSLAQSLLRPHSLTVGLITTDSYGRFSLPVLEGLEDVLGAAQRAVFMCNAADDPVRERQHVQALLAKRVDGIVVTARRTDPRPALDLDGATLPVVYAYTQVHDPQASCLLPDDRGGGALATRHLIRQGRRRIAHITGAPTFEAVRQRAAGYADALREAGLIQTPESVLHGPWSEAWGREAVMRLYPGGRGPDAIFCGSDQIARGALEALRDLELRMPQDVAVVGYDNWDVMADATRPTLTSVDMNLRTLGRQAGQRLLDLIGGGGGRGHERLPCQLVIRQSCGAATNGEASPPGS